MYRIYEKDEKNYCCSYLSASPYTTSLNVLYEIALLDNTCTLIGDFNIDLLKSHENNLTLKVFSNNYFLFFVLSVQQWPYTSQKIIEKKRRSLLFANLGSIITCDM